MVLTIITVTTRNSLSINCKKILDFLILKCGFYEKKIS